MIIKYALISPLSVTRLSEIAHAMKFHPDYWAEKWIADSPQGCAKKAYSNDWEIFLVINNVPQWSLGKVKDFL